MKQKPLLLCSDLTGTVCVVTRYKRHDDGVIEALEKYDVTDQYEALSGASATAARGPIGPESDHV